MVGWERKHEYFELFEIHLLDIDLITLVGSSDWNSQKRTGYLVRICVLLFDRPVRLGDEQIRISMGLIDLDKLSVIELEDLILQASEKRATLFPEYTREAPYPKEPVAADYYLNNFEGGTLLQLRHPGFGWITFILNPKVRAHILYILLDQVINSTKTILHNETVLDKIIENKPALSKSKKSNRNRG